MGFALCGRRIRRVPLLVGESVPTGMFEAAAACLSVGYLLREGRHLSHPPPREVNS